MDPLISLHRHLQKVVDHVGLRPVAQKVFRALYQRRYTSDQLARATQNGREWWLVPEVALRGALAEFETVEWLRSVVRPGMTVFDVGANIGQMTLEMAHLVGPTGRVIAIEPAPGNLQILRKHVSANGFDHRVTIIPAACSDVAGQEVAFSIFGDDDKAVGSGHKLQTLGSTAHGLKETLVRVKTVTVDTLCQEMKLTPKVLKIDVEGAEPGVLRGAARVMVADRPKIIFGFHPFAYPDPVEVARNVSALFRSAGYLPEQDLPPERWILAEYAYCPQEEKPR